MPRRSYSIKFRNKGLIFFAGALALSFLSFPAAAKIYKWTDDTGNIHYTDSPLEIPRKYRDKDKIETVKEGPADPTDPVIINRPGIAGRVVKVPRVDVNGGFFAEVLLNGKVKASLLVDTGASMVTLSEKIGEQLGFKSYANMPKIPFNTAGGQVMAPLLILRSVKVGSAKAVDVEANINPHLGGLGDGLLGMTFLGEYKGEVDKGASVMSLSPLFKRGETLWEGKNAEWWKTRLGGYSKQAWNYDRGASFYRKDDPVKSRGLEKLSDFYQKLYDNTKNRAVRVGVPEENIPPPLRHGK